MFEIPGAVQTILKDMQATGNDRPTAEVTIGGAPGGTSLIDPSEWTLWRTFVGSNRTWGNMTATVDGRAVIIYVEGGAVKLAYASSVPEILDGTKMFDTANAIVLTSGLVSAQTSIALIDGKLNVCITHIRFLESVGKDVLGAAFWQDTDGNGTGMAYVSAIAIDLSSGYVFGADIGAPPSMIHRLGTTTLVVMVPFQYWIKTSMCCCYSLDNGATWNLGGFVDVSLGDHLGKGCSKSFLILDDTSFIVSYLASSGSSWICLYTNNGAIYEEVGWTGDWGEWPSTRPWQAAFIQVGETVYLSRCGGDSIEVRKLNVPLTIENIKSFANWDFVWTSETDDGLALHHFTLTADTLILQHSATGSISGAGTSVDRVSLPIKSIVVDRSKGGASQAVVVIDNSLGMYAPDSIGPWAHIIWFNKVIQIKLGYGANQQLVFTGLIDTILMSTYPAELTIKARDYSKLALDQQPQDDFYEGYDGTPRYAFTYWNKTPEYIFGDMATQAGWAVGTVHVEVTGMTLIQFDSAHEKVADIFQRLCELTGFEWFTDEIGHVYFRKAKDPSAVSVYSFVEGIDIFSLSYELDDDELYRTIVVWSGDENRDVVKASGVWPAADYNNVLSKKTMIVNASDIVTDEAGAAAMVLAISNGMNPKVRSVDKVVVGHPYLQIGDLIQVTETTTWISEYYRITEISHQMNSTGSPVFGTGLKCFHFSYEG